jgi:hypothetical protein
MEVGGQCHVPASFYPPPPERDALPLVQRAGWVPGRSGLDGCGKSVLHRHAVPGPSRTQRVTIPTTVSRPMESFGSLLLLLTLQRMNGVSQSCEGFVVIFLTGGDCVQNAALQPHFRIRFGHGRQVLLYSFILPVQVNVVCRQGLYGRLQYCLFEGFLLCWT